MLDINQMLSSLLTLDYQGSMDKVSSDVLESDFSKEDASTIDVGAFVMLLAQMDEDNVQVIQKAEEISESIDMDTPNKRVKDDKKIALDSFQENVAVVWINSEFCPLKNELSSQENQQTDAVITKQGINNSLISQAHKDVSVANQKRANEQLFSQDNQKTGMEMEVSMLNDELFKNELLDNEIALPTGFSLLLNEDKTLAIEMQSQKFDNQKNPVQFINEASIPNFDEDKSQLLEREENVFSLKESNIPLQSTELASNASFQKISLEREGGLINHDMQFDPLSRQKIDTLAQQSFTVPLKSSIAMDNPQWTTQFSEQIVWMGQQDIKKAVIQVHPEELGPLEIKVNVENEIASVNIVSVSQQLREVIEHSLPLLQEMIREQGLTLGDVSVDVGTHSHFQEQTDFFQETGIKKEEEVIQKTPLNRENKLKGMVDYFA